jgi:hypothetical protein
MLLWVIYILDTNKIDHLDSIFEIGVTLSLAETRSRKKRTKTRWNENLA